MTTASSTRRAVRELAALDGYSAHTSKVPRPTLLDLLVGAPFADGSPEAEAASLASWLNLYSAAASMPELHRDLHLLACAQTPANLARASAACREAAAAEVEDADLFAEAAGLLDYYAACVGDADAALRVAACAVSTIGHPDIDGRTALDRGLAALGWLWFAGSEPCCDGTEPVRQSVLQAAEDILDRMARSRRAPPRRSTLAQPPAVDMPSEPTPRPPDMFDVWDVDAAETEHGAAGNGEVIVLQGIGNPDTAEGKRVATAFRRLVRSPLPLAPTPDLETVHRGLLQEYPHAQAAIDAIVGELVGQDFVALPPIVLVGEPGVGKTGLAGSLLDALRLPSLLFSCGQSAMAPWQERRAAGRPGSHLRQWP